MPTLSAVGRSLDCSFVRSLARRALVRSFDALCTVLWCAEFICCRTAAVASTAKSASGAHTKQRSPPPPSSSIRTRCLTTETTTTPTSPLVCSSRNRNVSALQNNGNPNPSASANSNANANAFCQRNQREFRVIRVCFECSIGWQAKPGQVELPQTERRLCLRRAKCVRPVCGLRKAESPSSYKTHTTKNTKKKKKKKRKELRARPKKKRAAEAQQNKKLKKKIEQRILQCFVVVSRVAINFDTKEFRVCLSVSECE